MPFQCLSHRSLPFVLQVFHAVGNKGNRWVKGTAAIGQVYLAEIVFEAVRGNSFASDVALDDISFANCQPGKGPGKSSLKGITLVILSQVLQAENLTCSTDMLDAALK